MKNSFKEKTEFKTGLNLEKAKLAKKI